MDLHIGLPSLAVEIENGMWGIPMAGHQNTTIADRLVGRRHKEQCNCPVCQWTQECFSFPIGLSDILMGWWIAREGYRNLGSRMGPRIRTIHIQTGQVRKSPIDTVGDDD